MANTQGPTHSSLRSVRRAQPYLRSYLQSLRDDSLIRRATLTGTQLLVLARSADQLPNPVVIDTPAGRVELQTRCVTTQRDYSLLRRYLRLPKRLRRKLVRQYPELADMELPENQDDLDKELRGE